MKNLLFSRRLSHLLLAFVTVLVPAAHGAGGPGYALNFDYSASYVSVPQNPVLNAYPLTVTAWFNTSQVSSQQGLVNKFLYGSFNGWQIYLDTGLLHASYMANGGSYVGDLANGLTANNFIADGLWHHVAFAVDATGGRLYVDGVLRDSRAWNGIAGATTTAQELSLGHYPGGDFYNGLLDEVTVWNVALSQAQILNNKNRSLVGTEAGLVAYYRCDETSGATVGDSAPAGGNNDGTWVGLDRKSVV